MLKKHKKSGEYYYKFRLFLNYNIKNSHLKQDKLTAMGGYF